ncbi:polyadenylate-binding protein-interacting protein 8 [Sorghum bicolor]|uniref:polyadenylate-binding protein-interacting protein 8 n=1 Tax=Sorghum bicolor TaxID=4558 RepID=UPI000B4242B7|nr:polyadenylate-binding protein-interacting protein 8 [Sorghum bicolor]|eukprot:XP_021309176.1 polyadenylate-binding protein-interacting protein 8 [Sorghum bicolor]
MAQVSIVTAARRADALNPDAREFLPWWRLGGSRKQLSVDAPEFIPTSWGKAAAAAAARGVVIARPNNSGTGRAARRPASNSRQDANSPRNAFFKSHRSQWDETVKRTIFVKYIDHTVTEETLACMFRLFGTVVDCRICGHPTSGGLRFGFVELRHEDEALASLDLDGSIIGISAVSVSRSRTAICPINPKFLPQSEAEWETCLRTIYCTSISKIVTSSNLKAFCEAYFGKAQQFVTSFINSANATYPFCVYLQGLYK